MRLFARAYAGFFLAMLTRTLALVGSLIFAVAAHAESGDRWILVDTRALTLSLMQGESVLLSYDNVAIGSNGATWNKRRGDEKTPKGDFPIVEIRPSERFHLFLALGYPNMDHAERALSEGRLDAGEYERISKALSAARAPPQDTRLGGYIGIHGVGQGSLDIHGNINWTDGCIALTNEQVDDLARRVRRGMRVRVR